MTWKSMSLDHLLSILSHDLEECSAAEREFFRQASIAPTKWSLPPWGDEGGGFWVVAVHLDRVLWYNDIEEGFNVSRFERCGDIRHDEYGCNQDTLRRALPQLQGEPRNAFGPPLRIPKK
jgi:hypothetical protein